MDSSAARLDRALDELCEELVRNLRTPQAGALKVAVLDFTTDRGGTCAASTRIGAGLTSRLFRSGRFQVIERQQLDRLLAEQRMSSSDLYDPSAVARLGGLIGAGAIVIGTLSPAGTKYEIHGRIVSVETSDVWSTAEASVRRGEIDMEGTCE